jgi:hypothetical protein
VGAGVLRRNVAADAADLRALPFVDPVNRIEKAREHSRGRAKSPLVVGRILGIFSVRLSSASPPAPVGHSVPRRTLLCLRAVISC